MTFESVSLMFLETLEMTIISTALAYILGIPIGILLNVTSKKGLKPNPVLNGIIGFIVNVLRSIPCLIIIVICMPWTRAWFGKGSGEWYTILIPLTVCAFGFVSRMIEQSLNEVPAEVIEGAKSLGASDFQIVSRVLISESRASLITGFAVVTVNILGYTSFAYNIGAGGVISGIYSFYKNNTGDFFKSWQFWLLIVLVIVIVQLIQEGGLMLAKAVDKRRKIK